jgi:hypothetical protein
MELEFRIPNRFPPDLVDVEEAKVLVQLQVGPATSGQQRYERGRGRRIAPASAVW